MNGDGDMKTWYGKSWRSESLDVPIAAMSAVGSEDVVPIRRLLRQEYEDCLR